MSKQVLWLAVAISLFAGAAQADAMDAQDGQPYPATAQSTPSELTKNPGATKPAQNNMAAQEAGHERQPAAGPVNPDCGQYGGE